ncbi:type VI secretion system baseplate subunit TssF [Robbsia sp. Bb-Pol-6]|uniref:Type VI secretion system baseplate subunit TssF n=1 Tax=Robbsia betulipollinis TaxID=2981849 RepID=A0ABT3ZPA4_9BURK|nr:type VI secretion system baseplate subunit TssF [Robbsia betulipollinis]
MSDAAADDILQYYKRELAYLRKQGADFAQRYPKVAAGLALHGNESLDPHTERLIESVAFLAARVHRDLDQSFPQIASALLDHVCPSIVQPVPSMSVVQLDLDARQGKVTSGYRVPRHTGVHAQTHDGETCRFRTAWDATLWPIRVAATTLLDEGTLCLTVETVGDADLSELDIDRLRLHLQGDWMETMPVYELLVGGIRDIHVRRRDGTTLAVACDAWREVGYGADDMVLSPPNHAYVPYVLLQEYFAFPQKFLFFDLTLPPGALGTGRTADITLRFGRSTRHVKTLAKTLFQLGCVPIVNLFKRSSEPIVFDRRHYEYPLVADLKRDATTEIYAIESVVAIDPMSDRAVPIESFTTSEDRARRIASPLGTVFWSARREHSVRQHVSGTELFISFVDVRNMPRCPSEPVVYVDLLCTNRRLAEQVPKGALMRVESGSRNVHVNGLYEPTAPHDPPLGSASLWRLVSLLTLNYRSLTDESDGVGKLRDMLALFATDSHRNHEQIHGISAMTTRAATARVGEEGWRGFCRGTEIVLEFEEGAFVGGSPLLLAAILARFFAMYTSVNSFVRLTARRGDETWNHWDAMSGRQRLL